MTNIELTIRGEQELTHKLCVSDYLRGYVPGEHEIELDMDLPAARSLHEKLGQMISLTIE